MNIILKTFNMWCIYILNPYKAIRKHEFANVLKKISIFTFARIVFGSMSMYYIYNNGIVTVNLTKPFLFGAVFITVHVSFMLLCAKRFMKNEAEVALCVISAGLVPAIIIAGLTKAIFLYKDMTTLIYHIRIWNSVCIIWSYALISVTWSRAVKIDMMRSFLGVSAALLTTAFLVVF